MIEATFIVLCAAGALTLFTLKATDAAAQLLAEALAALRRRRDVWFPEPHLGEAIETEVELSLEDSIRLVALAALLQREAPAR